MIGFLFIFNSFIYSFICVLGLYYSSQSVAYTSPNNEKIFEAIAKGVCGGWGGGGGQGNVDARHRSKFDTRIISKCVGSKFQPSRSSRS